MEPIAQSNSDEFLNNQEINEDINDIGLPKSSLHNFVKEILAKNKVRGDKNIIPMLDKISRQYVTYISSYGAKICTECGKKTLNLEHILEALKKMKFQKHIEKLVEHLKKNEKLNNSKDENHIDEENKEHIINNEIKENKDMKDSKIEVEEKINDNKNNFDEKIKLW